MSSKYRCTGCKEYFPKPAIAINAGKFHSIECATGYAQEKSAKLKVVAAKKSHTKAKKELKDNDRSFQLKKTQERFFNPYIRLRDKNLACISCQRHHSGQYHAGHYLTVGGHPALRFNPDNCHKQCSHCNNHQSGRLVDYRIQLIKKIGLARVEILEGPHEAKRYTINDLKEIQRVYKLKSKELEQC